MSIFDVVLLELFFFFKGRKFYYKKQPSSAGALAKGRGPRGRRGGGGYQEPKQPEYRNTVGGSKAGEGLTNWPRSGCAFGP